MKVVLVGPAYPYRGGIAHFNSEMAKALLEKEDIEVQIVNFKRLYPEFIFPGKTQFDESEKPFDVPSERLIDVCSPLSWFQTVKRIKELKPDIVFFQWWTPLTAIPYLLIIRGLRKEEARMVGLMHNIKPHENIPFTRRLFRGLVKGLDYLVVMSRGAETKLLQQFRGEERKAMRVMTLFHPLYDCFQKAAVNEEGKLAGLFHGAELSLDALENKRAILFFGLIRKYKGLRKLIEALPALNRDKETVLIVAGEFYEPKSEYIALVQKLKQETRCLFLDQYISNEDVSLVMQRADVLVCPYESGEQSGVIATALANRLPVIAMGGEGIGEIIEDGVTGLLLENNSSTEIAEKIEKFYQLSENVDFRGNIENKTRQYSWENFIKTIIQRINDGEKRTA